MNLAELSSDDIVSMSYNELIGLVRETNRIPGGNSTLAFISQTVQLNSSHRVLDIGTSVGPTSLELARLAGSEVVGIDINETSLEEARLRSDTLSLKNARFVHASATSLPFEESYFDLVVCGNVNSLIEDDQSAINEYRRVLKPNGYLAAVPMYYLSKPSDSLVERVRDAIKIPIEVKYREEAEASFAIEGFETYKLGRFAFDTIPEDVVQNFSEMILSRPHLDELSPSAKEALVSSYTNHMLLFRENLALMGYSVVILRKSAFVEDPMLFTATHLETL